MLKAALRTVAGVVLGWLAAFALVITVEAFSAVVHPLPEDFGGTTEEVCRHVERYPHWVLAVVVPVWALTAFAGTLTARRIGNRISSIVVGLTLLAALVLNLFMLPYPIWFKIANLLAIPASIAVGGRTPRPMPRSGTT